MKNLSARRASIRRLLAAGSVLLLLPAAYFSLRPLLLHRGATTQEIARPMPGDDLIAHSTFFATRAITIDAKPEAIWPWLVQMGYRRAGYYAYDLIENTALVLLVFYFPPPLWIGALLVLAAAAELIRTLRRAEIRHPTPA